jgi:hypothetical protein
MSNSLKPYKSIAEYQSSTCPKDRVSGLSWVFQLLKGFVKEIQFGLAAEPLN